MLGQSNLAHDNLITEVQKIPHYFHKRKYHKKKESIDNKPNRPSVVLYFDTLANLVKQEGYGKIHNADLRVLDYVTVNKFIDINKIETISYQTDYENNLSPQYRTKYYYDDKFHLVKEQVLYYNSDSLFMQFD